MTKPPARAGRVRGLRAASRVAFRSCPTGVGKTELARTVAAALFDAEEYTVRNR